MPRPFYYRTEAEIVSGSANFSAILTSDFAALGLTTGQASAIATVNSSLQSSWTAAVTPETRGPVSIEQKNLAIQAMRKAVIPVAQQIIGNPAVDDAQLLLLGLLPRTSPSPIVPDLTAPEADVLGVTGRRVKIRVRQPGAEGNSRPNGSTGAYIYTATGPSAPTDPSGYKFVGTACKPVSEVVFDDDVASGSTVWIAAAWVYRRGVRGFACEPVSTTIQGGPILASA